MQPFKPVRYNFYSISYKKGCMVAKGCKRLQGVQPLDGDWAEGLKVARLQIIY